MKNKDTETLVMALCAAFDRIASCDIESAMARTSAARRISKSWAMDDMKAILAPTLPILEERRPQWAAQRLAAGGEGEK